MFAAAAAGAGVGEAVCCVVAFLTNGAAAVGREEEVITPFY